MRPLKNTGERAPKLKQIRAGLKDKLVFQPSSKITIDWEKLVNSLWFGTRIDREMLQTTQKYHKRAEFVLYRINTCNPATPTAFVINTSDLTQSLRIELEQLQNIDPRGFDIVVTEAIQTLFDGINSRYYHTVSLPYKVTWRLEPLEGTMGSPSKPKPKPGSTTTAATAAGWLIRSATVPDTIAKEASYDITSKK